MKSKIIQLRVKEELHKELEQEAKEQCRTLSSLVAYYLKLGMEGKQA